MKIKKIVRTLTAPAAALVLGASLLPAVSAQAETVHDGSSSERAAASCYEIKQTNPEAGSGAYWLFTPQMEAPAQFYCDQETNGGGWVLIGRGREGWSEAYTGRGNAEELATNPDGTDAFTPVQLDSEIVDALLGNQAPSELEDGVRFRRATDTAGRGWQNLYAVRESAQNWSWALQGTQKWSKIRFDNSQNSVASNFNTAQSYGNLGNWDNRYNSMAFTTTSSFKWNLGFSYGGQVRGTADANSYLWSPTSYSAMPFTQVYVRPKLTQHNAGFEQIADTGLPAENRRQLPNNYSAAMKWRTSEETGTGVVGELNTSVQAIAEVNGTVFTGGDFKNVVSESGEVVNQSFLAGYTVDSADLVRSFTPTFNGQIKALEGLSNGKLAVGGEFSEVNGEKVGGFVVLDPVTGEIDRTYDWQVENRISGGVPVVKTIHEKNGYLYIGGAFTHIKGQTSHVYAFSRSAARFKMDDGAIDIEWRPNFNGTVNGISASDDGEQVFAAGYFTTNKGSGTHKLAALNTTDGSNAQPFNWKLSYVSPFNPSNAGFHFDVQTAGADVWTAGAEHLIAQYDQKSLERKSSSITKVGGDFQDLHLDSANNVIYGACHCGSWIFEGSEEYNNPEATARNLHRIQLVAAWDATTGEVLPSWSPTMNGNRGHGVWESFVDSTGVLWVGGNINKSMGTRGVQNTVGFARYTPRDVTPAAAPANLQVSTEGTWDKLSWDSKTAGQTVYQVLRNDRVIATTGLGETSYQVEASEGARYFVRSVDNAGNYSETTPVAISSDQAKTPQPTAEPTAGDPTEEPTTEPTEEPTTEPTADPGDDVSDVPSDPADPVDEPGQKDEPDDDAFHGEVISAGSEWQYQTEVSVFQQRAWYSIETAVRGWKTGKAPIGWGPDVATVAKRNWVNMAPISIQARKEFVLDQAPPAGKVLRLTTRADDGVVVYVNGQEVGRSNMPRSSGSLTAALSAVDTQQAIDQPVVIDIPAESLVQGKNVVAFEGHAHNRRTANMTMELIASWV